LTLAITILGGIAAAAVAAVLAHRFTSRRDAANRRSDLRIEYLVTAYRTLVDVVQRDLPPGPADARAFEKGIADIQLLGSSEHVEMALGVAEEMSTQGGAGLEDLLVLLRNDLREELQLESMDKPPMHLRMVGAERERGS
jgi:hypothetical protein